MAVFYFFSYRHMETRNHRTAWSLILSQIFKRLQNNHEILDFFIFAMSESKTTTATNSDLLGLFEMITNRLPRLTLLFDGIDECDNPEGFVGALELVLRNTRTKCILFSRPNIRTLARTAKLRKIHLNQHILDADIRKYIQSRLDNLQEESFPSLRHRNSMFEHLVDSTNGMFLWARLMMDYLGQDELNAEDREAAIESLGQHETLDDMYIRILRHISHQPIASRNVARQVFLRLSYSPQYCLGEGELWEAIYALKTTSAPPGLRDDILPSPQQVAKFRLSLTMRCGSLAEKHGNDYRFIHQSVVEFFRKGATEPNCQDPAILQFFELPIVAHNRLAMDCLSCFTFRIPAKPLSGDMRVRLPPTKIQDHLPFAKYAALSWPYHLRSGLKGLKETLPSTNPAVLQSLSESLSLMVKFTSAKRAIMTWIEVLYTLRLYTSFLASLEDLCSLFDQLDRGRIPLEYEDVPTRLRCFHKDLSDLDSEWGPTLTKNPHYIWNDVTAFFKSPFLQQTSALTVHSLLPSSLGGSEHCERPLTTVSARRYGGGYVAVLSIWPLKLASLSTPSNLKSY
jgi:hypothetical protein